MTFRASCVECGMDLIGARRPEMVMQTGTGLFIRESAGVDIDIDYDEVGGVRARVFCSEDCLDVWVTAQRLLANLEGSV